MITSSSETHTETTIPESLQTHVRGFLAAARVCVRGGRGAGAGRVKAVVAVIVAALLAGGLVAPAGGSSVRGAFANLQLVSSVPGELTISWDLPDPQPSDYRIMWAEEGLGFLSYRFANEALRGNEYPDGEATSVTLTGLTEGATYMVKARSRYSSGGRNNSRWSGPWSDKVTASVSVAAPVAQEPGDDQQQVNDPETQGNEQQVNDPETQGNEQQVDDPQVQGNEQQVDDPQVQGNDQQQQGDDQQQQGDDQQQQRDDSSVVSGKSVEDDEAVSEDRASRSEPADDDLSAGTDTVGAVELDSAALGTISDGFSLWDADWFAAELVAGSTYVIEVLGAGAGADCTLRGPVLERVYDADGTAVAGTETWDDGRDSLTKLTFTPASPGTYFVSVAGEANAAGTGTYILALTAAGPRSSERVAAIGAEGCVPTAPDKNADNTATSRIAPKKTAKPPPENNRITARSNHETAVTLASNLNKPQTHQSAIPSTGVDHAFITGPTEPGQNVNGYVLTKLEFFAQYTLTTVSIWTDSNGSRGEKLAEQTVPGASGAIRQVSADGLDVFLLPETKYWIRYETSGSATVAITNTNDEDSGTLAGWSFEVSTVGRFVRVRLSGFAAIGTGPLVSNSGQSSDSVDGIPGEGFDQSFETGPNTAGEYGYVLTELEFFARDFTRRDEMLVSVWTDSYNDSRDEKLAQWRVQGGGTTDLLSRVVDGLDVFLFPVTKYWIRFEADVGDAKLSITDTGDEDAGGVAGWSIGRAPTGYSGPIRVGLSGFAAAAGSSEPKFGGDLAASEDTTGSVSVGQVAYGSLFVDDRVGVGDERLVSVESFTRDRDWFKLVGLQAGRLYRVEVDFVGDGVVGGGIQMYQSTWGGTPVARSDRWDSNYDGNAVIDFRPIQSERAVTKWIMIESPNGMGSDRFAARNYFTGDYTVTLTDITGLKTMVSNTNERDDRLVFSKIGHIHDQEPELRGHNREVATSFTTGSHSAGYALDNITAYIQPGRTAAATQITAEIESIEPPEDPIQAAAQAGIVSFSEDSVDITVRSSTTVSTIAEPAVSIHSDNGGVPGDKLCMLEGLDGYDTGLQWATGDWPDRLYAGGCADITLTATTTYWIVFGSSERFPSSYYLVGRATTTAEDIGSNANWSIGNLAKRTLYTNTETGFWSDASYRFAVGVHATPK